MTTRHAPDLHAVPSHGDTTRRARRSRAHRLLAPILLSLVAVTFAAPALADDDDYRDRSRHGWNDRDDRHDRRWDRDDRRSHREDRRDWRREQAWRYEQQRRWEAQRQRDYYRHAYAPRPVVVRPRPVVRYAGPPAWARGRDYRAYGYDNVYYVPYDDYRRYDLYSPGYGQRWVRDDRGNFLLVAAATGIIASILSR